MSFEEWFKHYPKRNAIGLARQAYTNAIFFKNVTEEFLMDAVMAYTQLSAGVERQFIPDPHKWLLAERWHDEDIQGLIERRKEKKELSGWKKQLSDALGYDIYKSWCSDANLENGTLIVTSSFKANWLKNNHWQALERAGVNEIKAFQ